MANPSIKGHLPTPYTTDGEFLQQLMRYKPYKQIFNRQNTKVPIIVFSPFTEGMSAYLVDIERYKIANLSHGVMHTCTRGVGHNYAYFMIHNRADGAINRN